MGLSAPVVAEPDIIHVASDHWASWHPGDIFGHSGFQPNAPRSGRSNRAPGPRQIPDFQRLVLAWFAAELGVRLISTFRSVGVSLLSNFRSVGTCVRGPHQKRLICPIAFAEERPVWVNRRLYAPDEYFKGHVYPLGPIAHDNSYPRV